MTRRDLAKEEEEKIPVYLDSPFFEEDICYANWDNQLVWSDLGVSPWCFDVTTKRSKTKTLKIDFQDISTSQVFKQRKKFSLQSIKEHTFTGHSSASSGDTETTNKLSSRKAKNPQKTKTLQNQKTNKPKYHSFWKAQYGQYQLQ